MNQWMKAELLHNERWEDEGGAASGIEAARPTGRFVRPMLNTAGTQNIPRQWSRNFSIEPVQAGMAFGSSKRNAASRE